MSAPRAGRVAITLTPGERAALRQLAREAAEPEARTAARLLRAALAEHHMLPLDAPSRQRRGPRQGTGITGAAWLPPTRRLFDIEALRARYPRELRHLPPDPLAEPAIAEPLAALTVWRERLDSGEDNDPLAELAFAQELHGLAHRLQARTTEGRRTAWTPPAPPNPDDHSPATTS